MADFRYSSAEDRQTAEAAVKEVCEKAYIEGCHSEYSLMSYRVSMPIRQRNLDLLAQVNEFLAKEGLQTLVNSKKTGGSDGSDVSEFGIPCLDNLGIRGGKSHSENEFAYLASLEECAIQLAAILYQI